MKASHLNLATVKLVISYVSFLSRPRISIHSPSIIILVSTSVGGVVTIVTSQSLISRQPRRVHSVELGRRSARLDDGCAADTTSAGASASVGSVSTDSRVRRRAARSTVLLLLRNGRGGVVVEASAGGGRCSGGRRCGRGGTRDSGGRDRCVLLLLGGLQIRDTLLTLSGPDLVLLLELLDELLLGSDILGEVGLVLLLQLHCETKG